MQVQLPTGALVTPSSYYPLDWNVQQAIAEVYNSYGIMTYCKPKTLRKFGEIVTKERLLWVAAMIVLLAICAIAFN